MAGEAARGGHAMKGLSAAARSLQIPVTTVANPNSCRYTPIGHGHRLRRRLEALLLGWWRLPWRHGRWWDKQRRRDGGPGGFRFVWLLPGAYLRCPPGVQAAVINRVRNGGRCPAARDAVVLLR
ncbi:hypothetical protein VPH35_053363 [Triticum aestivum]